VSTSVARSQVQDGLSLWFTGLPGAGKSTVASLVRASLDARGVRTELLDGDIVRTNLCRELGYSKEDRETNIRRIAFVADLLSRNGVVAITAAISPYRSMRDEARVLMGDRFVEIHVNAPLEECIRRDPKGMYAKAQRGEIAEFTGISQPYESPLRPEIVLDTGLESPAQSAGKVIAFVEQRLRPAGT
jgi:adenylylsulfate kinase